MDYKTQEDIFRLSVEEYANRIDEYKQGNKIDTHKLSRELLIYVNQMIISQNTIIDDTSALYAEIKPITTLHVTILSMLLVKLYDFRTVQENDTRLLDSDGNQISKIAEDSDSGILTMYNENTGLCELVTKSKMSKMLRKYNATLKTHDVANVYESIRVSSRQVTESRNDNWIVCNNGIFDTRTKKLLEFDPKFTILNKSNIDYKANAVHPEIKLEDGNMFNIVDLIKNYANGDEDIEIILLQVIKASLQPNKQRGKCILLYSERGNNGKGTYCTIIENLLGSDTYTNLPIADFGNNFAKAKLIGKSAVITHENGTNSYLDRADAFKAAVTGDSFSVDRKNESMIDYTFKGTIIQCVNGMPISGDKSESFLRRFLMIPFDCWFGKNENDSIKQQLIHRQDILEYLLHYILHNVADFDKYHESKRCNMLLELYAIENDSTRQFFDEVIKDNIVYVNSDDKNTVSKSMLYTAYKNWMRHQSPNTKLLKQVTFNKTINNYLVESNIKVRESRVRYNNIYKGRLFDEVMNWYKRDESIEPLDSSQHRCIHLERIVEPETDNN